MIAIEPLVAPPDTTVVMPGSKSITNRALVCAAMASGRSVIDRALLADDTGAMIEALGVLGAVLVPDRDEARIIVEGVGGATGGAAERRIDARMSGTTSRFLMPVAATTAVATVIDGHEQLRARPMADLVRALESLGVAVTCVGEPEHLPVRVVGPIRSGETSVAADSSSQFLSGLLLAGALTPEGLTVRLTTEPVSRPYLHMTAGVMRSFGAVVEEVDERTWRVEPGGYRAARHLVEPDASAASYFLAAAAITGGRVGIDGLGRASMQGDVGFAEVLAAMGAEVEVAEHHVEVTGRSLRGIEVDLGELSDTVPTLAAVAALADGPTTITGVGFIRGKESDRLAAPVAELNRLGVPAEETDDGLVVRPVGPPLPGRVRTYGDHRMAMAFSLIGLVRPGIEIVDPSCVAKTFPGFFSALDQLR